MSKCIIYEACESAVFAVYRKRRMKDLCARYIDTRWKAKNVEGMKHTLLGYAIDFVDISKRVRKRIRKRERKRAQQKFELSIRREKNEETFSLTI